MQRMIWAILASFFLVMFIGRFFLPALRKLRFGQNIHELAPQTHKKKQGVPTMGGLMTALVTVIVAIALHKGAFHPATDFAFAVLLLSLGNLAIGFLDDLTKVRSGHNGGLTPKQKMIGQTLLAILFALYCYFHPQIGSAVIVPFLNWEWNLGLLYIPIMVLAIVFMTNSANLLDGLDGLLSSVSIVDNITLGIMAFLLFGQTQDENYLNLAVLLCAVGGAYMGFLRYNFFPARLIMGDTGSMFLGGMVVGSALVMRQPILLLLIAVCMVVSSLSVILQRVYYSLTNGKRIFKMSPLHHHFELSGVAEPKIVVMYAVTTAIACLIALLAVLPQ